MSADSRRGARRRIAALLRVLLAEALRRGRSSEGVDVRPLRQVLFASTLLGVFAALPLRHETAVYWVQALFAYGALYTALAVVPDPHDVFERRRDLLGPLPLRPVEAAVARIGFLGVLVVLLLGPLSLPSLAWLLARGELGPLQAGGLLGAILGVGFTVTSTWLYLSFVIGRFLGVDRLRKMASLLMSLLIAGSSIVGSSELWVERPWPPGMGAGILAALPTSWFAAPFLAPGAAGLRQGAAALLLIALAALLAARTDPTRAYSSGVRVSPERDSWAGRALARLDRSRSPRADRRLLPLVVFLSRVWSRDPFTAIRVRAFAASAGLLIVVGFVWQPAGSTMPVTVAILGLMALADGAMDLSSCSDADAVWLLDSAPLASGDLVAAMRAVVLAERGVLAAVALAVVGAYETSVTAGLALAVGFLGAGYLLVSGVLLLRPSRPFSRQASASRGTTAIWLATPLAIVGLVAMSPAYGAALLPAGADVVAALLLAGTLYAFGRAFGLVAAGRQARLVAHGQT
jgi:hypothetical protein